MAGTTLTFDIRAEDRQALAALKRIQKELHDTGTIAERSSTSTLSMGDALAGLAIGAGVRVAINEFEEAEKTAAQTAAAIKSTGNAAEVSASQQDKLVESLSKTAAVDDEVVAGGANVLRTFTAIKGENFGAALGASLDVAAAKGTDLASTANALGKALQDPVKGLSALTRIGVAFSAQQRQQIKDMVEAGDVAGAQKIILAELETEFGGQAEAAATSSAKMKVAFGDAAESLGGALAPALQVTAEAAQVAGEAVSVLPGPIKALAVAGAAAALVGPRISSGFSKASGALGNMRDKSRQLEAGTASMTAKLQGAAVGVAALGGALASGVEAWQQWGQQGRDAATSTIDQMAANTPKTTEELRKLADQTRDYADSLLESQAGGLRSMTIDRDYNRSLQEGAAASRERADAFDAAAKKIEQAAQQTGLSVDDVNEIIEEANLDSTTMSTEQLAEAIAKWGRESGNATPSARLAADAAKEQADAFDKAVGSARDLFDAQQGVDEAARGVADAQAGVADAHQGVEEAERSLADAHRGVEEAARGVADAERALSDASADLAQAQSDAAGGSKELRQANDAVVDAEHALADAQRASKAAQEDLTAARNAARESLDDLARSAEGAALGEESARLSLEEAKQRLAELGKDGQQVSDLDRERAVLAVKQAELALRDAIDRNQDTARELADATARGVEGSDEVVAAKERITAAAEKERDAQDKVRDAQERVTEIQEQLADRVAEAQRKVEEASLRVRDAHQAVADAQQRVSDAAASVVEARGQVTTAEDKVTDALLRQIEARQVLDAMQVGASGSIRQQIDRYRELAATLDPSSPLRQHLLQLADALEGVAGTYDINLAIHSLGEAPPGAINAERQFRASGGPVRRGVPYIVGERRAEVFTPEQDGRIVPSVEQWRMDEAYRARDARRTRGAAPAAGGVIVNVTVPAAPDPDAQGQAIGRAVGWALSCSGSAA